MGTVGYSIESAFISMLVIGILIAIIWSKISGKPITKIIQELTNG